MTINAESQGNFCANTKHTNIHIIGDPEEERERTQENFWRDNSGKLPQYKKGNSLLSPGSIESQGG